MSMPFYASAEQIMRDRSEYARKGIARGGSVVVLTYVDGVVFVAETRSSTLHKVSEIYDRIGFAAVGKYNEFENLRVAGIRLADLRGYSYDRRDVTARALANAYAQTLGSIFTEQQKPYEVELCVAEVAATAADDQLYRLAYDGTIVDEPDFMVMGGQAETVATAVKNAFRPALPLDEAVTLAVSALASVTPEGGAPRTLTPDRLEVAVLDRNRGKRKFRRIAGAALASLLPEPAAEEPGADESGADESGAMSAPPAADTAETPGADTPETPGATGDDSGDPHGSAPPTQTDGAGGNGAGGDAPTAGDVSDGSPDTD
ncbi:MAG TPA: proteasome subunit alpha [Jatrophihabitans sp.]|jgi:proteasome alpha subunit